MSDEEIKDLSKLLDVMDHAATAQDVSVRDVLQEFGERSITPFILVLSLLLISPISGVPGVPTISAIIIVSLAVQALVGRQHIWLPEFVLRREISGERLRYGVSWMRKPCAFLDRHSHKRFSYLTKGPMRYLNLMACVIIPLGWPVLELLPMVTSAGALTIALITFGLFTRDGLYVLLGYGMIGLTAGLVWYLWT